MGKKSKKGRTNSGSKSATTTAAPLTANTTTVTNNANTNTDATRLSTPFVTTKEEVKVATVALPVGLESSLSILTPSQKALAIELALPPYNQSHIFQAWETATDAAKLASMEQLERMDKAYPSGGLKGYVQNARDLLEKSRQGVNPLEGWKPEVPQGESVDVGTDEYVKFEKIGIESLGKCGFALVAGGLGERLGYGGIKVCLRKSYSVFDLFQR